MLGLGALGVAVGGPVSSVIAKIGENDPTGLAGLLPATGGFRYYSVVGKDPEVSPADYRLTVNGLVANKLDISFADLAAMRKRDHHDFNASPAGGSKMWPGPGAVGDLLRLAQVSPTARAVRFTSFDGVYTESLTMEQAMRSDVLVASSMLGGPVSNDHGGPVRLFVAPMYGYKSLKWLGGIEATSTVQPGYWEVRGYDADAWVGKSNGRDDAPTV
jgi:DMSO/TMAO reductase YedYZ molybdopterin-dependent catalytic subunit